MLSIESPRHELSKLLKSLLHGDSASVFLGIINQHALTNSQDAKHSSDLAQSSGDSSQEWTSSDALRNLPLMESPSSKVDGRPIVPNPGVSEPCFLVWIPKTRGLIVRSRTHLVLLRKELEGAVLPPPGRQQKPSENTELAWGPQPEPAELKCTKGSSRSSSAS